MAKRLMVGVVAGLLLAGASAAQAQDLGFERIWLIAGVQSASGEVEAAFQEQQLGPDDVCAVGSQAIRELGFVRKETVELEPKLTALVFEKIDDTAALLCAAVRVG